MGVAFLRSWLISRYPLILRSSKDITIPPVHNLFIDFTNIIFQAMKISLIPESYDQPDLIVKTLFKLDEIIQSLHRSLLIYIACDGNSGSAKISKSRKRMGVSKSASTNVKLFTKNSMSRGTSFSHEFYLKLKKFIEQRKSSWEAQVVIFDSILNPGEAEHKIFRFIHRQVQCNFWDFNATTFIFSPDSDLILFSLHTKINNLYLISKSDHNLPFIQANPFTKDTKFDVLSTDTLKECIQIDLCSQLLEPPLNCA
jgi:5'-3' exonuclease